MFGALMLVATVVVLTLLGTLDSGIEANSKSYYTESQYLVIFDSFLVSIRANLFFLHKHGSSMLRLLRYISFTCSFG